MVLAGIQEEKQLDAGFHRHDKKEVVAGAGL